MGFAGQSFLVLLWVPPVQCSPMARSGAILTPSSLPPSWDVLGCVYPRDAAHTAPHQAFMAFGGLQLFDAWTLFPNYVKKWSQNPLKNTDLGQNGVFYPWLPAGTPACALWSTSLLQLDQLFTSPAVKHSPSLGS